MLSQHTSHAPTPVHLATPRPGELVHPQRTFHHEIDIYLKDSNAYANTYFSRYFEWQGICRERWFHKCISADMLQSLGVFITKRAHQEYIHETFPFQTVQCRLNTFEVKQCSFYLLFEFLVGGEVASNGYQQIVFASHGKRIQRLPDEVLAKMREYETPTASLN
jgi:acyl-CoA thioesterase FadM